LILLSIMLRYPMDIIVNRYLPIFKSNIWLIYFLILLQAIRSNFLNNNNNNWNRWIINGRIARTSGYWKNLISAQHW
jgi:hypothetical protein